MYAQKLLHGYFTTFKHIQKYPGMGCEEHIIHRRGAILHDL